MFAKAFTFASLASLASTHMLMNNPKPYGSPDNSPLDASGSNFPCKGAVNDGSVNNVYKQGSTQQLSFTGQAVHGGGSCQVSLTPDKNPTKDSVWKVIKSIEGGCPSRTATGNLGDNAKAENPDKYDFTIPEELAAGEYTLAWTWFNHVGNREMYMNCAAVTVEGSGGSKDYLSTLPDMFVANIGNQCETLADTDLKFPNPGKDVSQLKSKLADPKGEGCQKAVSGGGSGGSGGDGPQPSAPVATTTTNDGAQPTQPATTPAPSAGNGSGSGSGSGDGSNGAPEIPGGAFITVSQPSAPHPTATQAPAAPETPKDGSGSGSGSGNQGGDSGSGSGGFVAGTACTNEGEWNCIGGSTFQRCASGAWTTVQELSSGVTCTPGQGADIAMTTKRGKRNMRRANRSQM
ncbi:spore coat sp96 precursor [Fusarium beomiforme]|uniref:Spore coat sp96 n=1 Tax=Fusarium beomiforme TaxID=44412 RepID=A0A9P5E6C2_9HYPO|nr:spore coat sp96 precursor [Fusarium beomiforme]